MHEPGKSFTKSYCLLISLILFFVFWKYLYATYSVIQARLQTERRQITSNPIILSKENKKYSFFLEIWLLSPKCSKFNEPSLVKSKLWNWVNKEWLDKKYHILECLPARKVKTREFSNNVSILCISNDRSNLVIAEALYIHRS